MKIAIFGAGQLAMMMIQESINLEHEFIIIDPSSNPPASRLSKHIKKDYTDKETLDFIAKNYDIATIDFENVDITALKYLDKYIQVSPPPRSLEVCQDRLLEKNFFKGLNINVTNYASVSSLDDIKKFCRKEKSNYLLKSRRFGYDGKNQLRCSEDTTLLEDLLLNNDCIVEEIVDFQTEVSLICVRQDKDNFFFYPLVENFHDRGILKYSIFPYENKSLQKTAEEYALNILNDFDYIGALVIEFFVAKDGRLIANEMAPRVHNSGHWSIEGCSMSQFQAHIRAITGTLDCPASDFKSCIMLNVLSKYPNKEELNKLGKHFFHSYGKDERKLRKLGHITLVDENYENLIKSVTKFLEILDS